MLLSGENGSGKSTILDAIQFVITASKNNFNKAAHENGKRKLAGYVRCKTGKENRPYERTGQVSAHVALEFYDEDRKTPFIVGAVVDSASDDKETAIWYLLENETIKEELFCQGKQIRTIDMFRMYNSRTIKLYTKTQAEARKVYKSRFGRLDDKFFKLIPKSIAFKPINDIKDFVYSYVLDKRDINIEVLRENVRTYQEFLIILDSIRTRLGRLEKINERYDDVLLTLKREKIYDYYLARIDLEINLESIKKEEGKINKAGLSIDDLQKEIQRIRDIRSEKEERQITISAELAGNEEFLALEKIKKETGRISNTINQLSEEKITLLESIKIAMLNAKGLSESGCNDQAVDSFIKAFSNMEADLDMASAREALEAFISYKDELYKVISNQCYHQEGLIDKYSNELKEIELQIGNLEKKRLNYNPMVIRLKEAIEDGLIKLNRSEKPKVLCELLEISDERWRNAVEGYLNTQRFYLLVEPDSFDLALNIYDRLQHQEGVFGVGLINSSKLEKYEAEPVNTLATVVTSKNKWAKRYINMILGKVTMCDRPEELKGYPDAITPECMRYKNHVASAINPSIYEVPYIGMDAYRVQLEQMKMLKQEKIKLIKSAEDEQRRLSTINSYLSKDADIDIKYRLSILSDLQSNQILLSELEEEVKRLEANSTFIQKQFELDRLKDEIKQLNYRIEVKNQEQGSHKNIIETSKASVINLEKEALLLQDELGIAEDQLEDDLSVYKQEYNKLVAQKNLYKFKDDYINTRKGNETRKNNAINLMLQLMMEYKSAHDFGAEASLQGYKDFFAEYDKLKNSELLSYEQRVYDAKEAAEQEFREQFLSKLQENIKKAHSEFNDLNKALKNITFGKDKYKFEYSGSKKYQLYYKMIMDDFNVMQGESIFSGLFHDNHKEVIEELFDKLTADSENSQRILEEFTDYRTYMDYDIKIEHGDEGFSYYSKVCEEKSGGETQTPFYVTVAASFMQLYSSGIGGDAIGLIMFDEAFNNMDDERIAGVLEFLSLLPLQIIIAAPPDKIQYIQPTIKNVSLVLQDSNISYVESFAYEGV
jgi:uncharacterized protein YPO0396